MEPLVIGTLALNLLLAAAALLALGLAMGLPMAGLRAAETPAARVADRPVDDLRERAAA
jgi:hypothetical protein